MIDEKVKDTDEQKPADGVSDSTDAASTPGPSAEEALAAAKAELAALSDRFLRQAADFQNFRKRSIEERAYSVEIGKGQIALPMVDVLDDLRRSLSASDGAEKTGAGGGDPTKALRDGVGMVFEKMVAELAKIDVVPMHVMGEQFDEQKHDALMQRTAPEGVESGTILAEIQKGYLIGEKVLRHARVIVAA